MSIVTPSPFSQWLPKLFSCIWGSPKGPCFKGASFKTQVDCLPTATRTCKWLKRYTTCVALQLSRCIGVAFFALCFGSVARESRYTPESVSKKAPSHPFGGCRTLSWPCIYHNIVSRYRGCRSYSVASRATLRH